MHNSYERLWEGYAQLSYVFRVMAKFKIHQFSPLFWAKVTKKKHMYLGYTLKAHINGWVKGRWSNQYVKIKEYFKCFALKFLSVKFLIF